MDRTIKLAACVAVVEHLAALGSSVIPLMCLRAYRVAAQCHFAFLERFAMVQKLERVFLLEDKHFVGVHGVRGAVLCLAHAADTCNGNDEIAPSSQLLPHLLVEQY